MTRRGEDPVERDLLVTALIRTLRGETSVSSGRVSSKAIASEAGLPRTSLTHKHRDLNELVRLVKELDKKARNNQSEEVNSLRTQNAELQALVDTLAAQVTLASMRLRDSTSHRPKLVAGPSHDEESRW
ncbi:hypothetical protein FEF26_12715 [Nesterenkonia salmonea]|uniref:Uncharacterized protein n=1 Tax=Nesterenkonia salmonea TaxID=1804987 RepID=A0A5R9B866_9MICC|nr:hypothetical protein [Nesterenkonia salmonea]TLP93889.1 hypothetical protein FEF26_12715 [Nesterenkonia salmonea]